MAEFITTNIEQQLSQLNLNQQSTPSSSSSLEISMASMQQPTWRQIVDDDLRRYLADKLLEALPISQIDLQQEQKHHYVEYSKKLENHLFEVANSRAEYYHLISLKIYELQKEKFTGEQPWRDSVAVELRKHIVNKLAQTIIPGCCDLENVEEQQQQNSMRNLLDYAQKIECEIFMTATSRSGYYKLIGEKLYNLQQGIDEELSDDCCC